MDTKRHVALPDDLWTATKVQAAIEGVNARDIVIRSLRAYLDRSPAQFHDIRTNTTQPYDTVTTVRHDVDTIQQAGDFEDAFAAVLDTIQQADRDYLRNAAALTPGFGTSRPAPKPTKKR